MDQGFPLNSQAITDPNTGIVTQAWRQFFVSLWNRTGGTSGASTFNPGDLKPSASAAAQTGWLACDGSAVSRTIYSALFAVIGVTWGPGDGLNTFNLPDLRGRALMGANGTSINVGDTGGAASVTLSVAQLPAHDHPVVDPGHDHTFTGTPHTHSITDAGHSHTTGDVAVGTVSAGASADGAAAGTTGVSVTGITVDNATAGGTLSVETTGLTVGNRGGGTAVPTLPPYAGVAYLIKT